MSNPEDKRIWFRGQQSVGHWLKLQSFDAPNKRYVYALACEDAASNVTSSSEPINTQHMHDDLNCPDCKALLEAEVQSATSRS